MKTKKVSIHFNLSKRQARDLWPLLTGWQYPAVKKRLRQRMRRGR